MVLVLPVHLSPEAALALCECDDLDALAQAATARRDAAHGALISYSRKVFIPLTRLCRDVCHYCTFAQPPRRGHNSYLSLDEVLAIASAGVRAGCKEALFTLGDKPELRYAASRATNSRGWAMPRRSRISRRPPARCSSRPASCRTSIQACSMRMRLRRCARCRFRRASCWRAYRGACASAAARISDRPTRIRRCGFETIRLAGEQGVPLTTGILIGIGETRAERVQSLLAIRDLHERYGHIQEVIIQNFRAQARHAHGADARRRDSESICGP